MSIAVKSLIQRRTSCTGTNGVLAPGSATLWAVAGDLDSGERSLAGHPQCAGAIIPRIASDRCAVDALVRPEPAFKRLAAINSRLFLAPNRSGFLR
jgi:hypothetical protein